MIVGVNVFDSLFRCLLEKSLPIEARIPDSRPFLVLPQVREFSFYLNASRSRTCWQAVVGYTFVIFRTCSAKAALGRWSNAGCTLRAWQVSCVASDPELIVYLSVVRKRKIIRNVCRQMCGALIGQLLPGFGPSLLFLCCRFNHLNFAAPFDCWSCDNDFEHSWRFHAVELLAS